MDRSALRPEPGSFWAAEHMKHLVCAQILNVCGKKERRKKNTQRPTGRVFFILFFFVSNQNRDCDSDLWKSLSVPAWVALSCRVNNTCVTSERCDISKVRQVVGGSGNSSGLGTWKRCPATESVEAVLLIKGNAAPTVSQGSYPLKVTRRVEFCLVTFI